MEPVLGPALARCERIVRWVVSIRNFHASIRIRPSAPLNTYRSWSVAAAATAD
jgi:hypothetical protein